MSSLRPSAAFSLVVLVTLVLYGLIGLMVLMMQFQPGFMGMAHGTQPHHRVHDLTFAFLLVPGAIGLLAQLRAPARKYAGQVMALIPWIALLLAFVLAGSRLVFAPAPVLGALTLIATILHPGRRHVFRSFSIARASPVMLALVIVAAGPLLALASSNIGLQRTLTNDHAALGHYGFMAAFSLAILGIGLLAGLRLAGWTLAAWVAGALPMLLGLASLAYPGNDSSLNQLWAFAAIAWGVAFVAAAGLARKQAGDIDEDMIAEPAGETVRGASRSLLVLGIIALVLALAVLFAILHLSGGGPARHTS